MAEETTITETSNPVNDFMAGLPSLDTPLNPVADALEKATAAAKEEKPPEKPAPAKPDAKPATAAPKDKPAPEPPKAGTEAVTEKDWDDETKWPRSSADWKRFRENRAAILKEKRELEEKHKALAAELESAKKATPTVPTDYEDLKKRNDELDRIVRQSALEHHPQFVEHYSNLTKSQFETAKRIVGTERAGRVEQILSMPEGEVRDAALEELGAELTPIKQAQLGNVLARLSEIHSEKEFELRKARDNMTNIQAAEQAKAAETAKRNEKFVDDTLSRIRGEDEFTGVLDDEAAQLTRAIALGGVKDASDTVKIIARGVSYPKAIQALQAAQTKVSELEAQVASLTKAQPGAAGGLGEASTPDSDEAPEGANRQELMESWIKSFGKAMNR